MSNLANQPFADALARQYPAPDGIKIFTASAEAKKMLAFWSVKQTTTGCVLRIGDTLFRVVLHSCPECGQHLSASALKMSAKEREMMAALTAMLKQADASKPASKAPAKPAKPVTKQATPAPKAAPAAQELTEEQMAELEALTNPGGAQ